MNHYGFMPHGYCLRWDFALILIYVLTDGLVALAYYSIPAALFLIAFNKRQKLPVQPLLVLFGLFIAFCGGGHAIDIISLWKPVYWLKGIWNIGTAGTSVLTAAVLLPKVLEFVRMPETAARLQREKTQLEREQSLIRAMLDSTLEGMILADSDGRTLLYNAAASRILGFAEGEPPSVSWPEHPYAGEDIARLPNGRIVERFTREVPGYGRLFVLRDITERRALEEQRLRLERIIETMVQGFAIVAPSNGEIISTNASFDRMYGGDRGEFTGQTLDALLEGSPEFARAAASEIVAHALGERYWEGDLNCRRKDGSVFVAHARMNLHDDGATKLLSIIQVDVTEQKRLQNEAKRFEARMLETAKLESVGVLAGGIAHDFNNLLTGILGSASLIYEQLSPSSPLRPRVNDVIKASRRAAELTSQLLAYAGKGKFLIETIEINSLIRDIQRLVSVTIPRNVQVSIECQEKIGIEGDRGQFHQLLMNLIINAAEAIGESRPGCVVISTATEYLERRTIRELFGPEALEPGEYAIIRVQDNGSGMSPDTMAHMFEPFFTTKFTGRGLGLAAAHGIVRGHRGALKVESELGVGTKFTIYLPAAPRGARIIPAEQASSGDLAGTGAILVVDDEEAVRTTARNTLEFYGYHVIEAENGSQAVELFRESHERVALMLLDLTMPVMSGEEALRQLREIDARVPIILSSGFNETEALRRFGSSSVAGFLQKPFTSTALAETVKNALARRLPVETPA